ncbi:glycine cleavage system transcriptional repressor [Marisediminitalea aggregata]|jgi:glycine cleavage system transcriptional repressor|uniref:Glycine cleavage system transcriptional repressor n=1 Tax=Marisediminitalea aggregata TaxID=634436 RepID=A0A1M5PYF5_9ALTE|nr:ACT domain-containing protein [Marisediminitalea aggregata]MAP21914.1 glycine cleavage system transcriptional repressor [Alteromonadaceae bacterium]MCP4528894.1 glycine cleavage system transcriptional repressor [Aestuariibacter sp.]BBO27899.1 glycine cleavage system transcriptional regulator [Alteromonas sp. I4]HBY41398.1 glycine cleavage system transcriptional repressor [Alteromonas sp.]MAX43835.1 glycine cleavage system transcriptional repressor [Alteromonadaceae bacterium]|tara:strand:+ start:2065 stop:2598 length:534 start_codon:yes stop_codon:yes gene_type:complete
MKQQLIAVILGTDQVGILSDIATLVSESECNILDSRHAIYGQEFSLTMIIEGSHTAITRVELSIPELCQRRDLLSILKRTREHTKQNLTHLYDVEFSGVDNPGQIQAVTRFFADQQVSISAFRQTTAVDEDTGHKMMRFKLVVNIPDDVHLAEFQYRLELLCQVLHLTGKIVDKHKG